MHVCDFQPPTLYQVIWFNRDNKRIVSGGHALAQANQVAKRLQDSGKAPVIVQLQQAK